MSEKRCLILTPDNLSLAIHKSDVVVGLDFSSAGVFPELEVAIRMTPSEARLIAAALIRKAGEAEAGLPRA